MDSSKIKIKFITQSKQIENIPLNPISQISNFQSLNQNDELKKTRMDEIDKHYQYLNDILASKMKSGISTSNKYSGPQITDLHLKLFGNKGSDKNTNIDNIIEFYTKKYVPRQTRNYANSVINTTDTDIVLKSNINIFGANKTNYDLEDEENEDIDF